MASLVAPNLVGCSPDRLRVWGGIVAQDVEDQVDALLGKERVARQRAIQDIARLEEYYLASSVEAELLGEKLVLLRDNEASARAGLGRLAALIEQGTPVRLGDGNVWDVAQLERFAQSKIIASKLCNNASLR